MFLFWSDFLGFAGEKNYFPYSLEGFRATFVGFPRETSILFIFLRSCDFVGPCWPRNVLDAIDRKPPDE